MKIIECVQGSDAWFAARLGKVSASRVADVVAKTSKGWGASRANYAAELVAERLTGATAEKYSNAAMAWGTETEPQARSMYEFMRDCDVVEVGTVLHPTIEMSCASPDGVVSSDGLVEIKCPNTATHIETLLGDKIAAKYITQMQWQMACTGRLWCDFVSFDPRMPGDMQILVKRVHREVTFIEDLEEEVRAFLGEIDQTINSLVARYRTKEAAE